MKAITLTEEQYKALTNGEAITIRPPKTKAKWEPKGGNWYIEDCGKIYAGCTDSEFRGFGHFYQTKEQAEWARDKMRSFNRQLAWLAENDDGWREDWSNSSQNKWYIGYDHSRKRYVVMSANYFKDLKKIYMSADNAKKLADLLNSGEVEL